MMMNQEFSFKTRAENINRLANETFDILVIGGGITGAGIANVATQQGYKVALVEQGDFASGTSSQSSKLIHGGMRYLAQLDFKQVAEACQQRHHLYHIAPHLVHLLPFTLPFNQGKAYSKWRLSIAMWLYNRFTQAAQRQAAASWSDRQPVWPASTMWSAKQSVDDEPILNSWPVAGAAHYYDCVTDDARLTLSNIIQAHRAGGVLANYVKMTALRESQNRICGAMLVDKVNQQELEVRARLVVSALGPWTNQFLASAKGPDQPAWLHPSKGIHLVVPRNRLPHQSALIFKAPQDGRYMFLIPWGEQSIMGTTDTSYRGDPAAAYATIDDVTYILETLEQAFPHHPIIEADVLSTFAGVRPLLSQTKSPSSGRLRLNTYNLSRQHRVEQIKPGLLCLAGGKLTTYRTMAKEALEMAKKILGPKNIRSTEKSYLPGGNISAWLEYQREQVQRMEATTQLAPDIITNLIQTYGTEANQVIDLCQTRPSLGERIHPDTSYIKAQVIYAIRYEMALTLADVLRHRTQVMLRTPDQGLQAASGVARLMAEELGWWTSKCQSQIAAYQKLIEQSRRWQKH